MVKLSQEALSVGDSWLCEKCREVHMVQLPTGEAVEYMYVVTGKSLVSSRVDVPPILLYVKHDGGKAQIVGLDKRRSVLEP